MIWSVSFVVDANLGESGEPGARSFSVVWAGQVLSHAWKRGNTVAVRLELGELGVRGLSLALGNLVGVLDVLEEDKIGDADLRAEQELSVVSQKLSGPRSETSQRLLVEGCSGSSFGEDKLDEVHNALITNGIQLHDLSLFREIGAEQLRLELVADVSVNRERLGHVDITVDDEGQVGEINGLAALESCPLIAAHLEVLLFPISTGVGEKVARDVTPVNASERPVGELDFVTSLSLNLGIWKISDTCRLAICATAHLSLIYLLCN